MKSGFSKTAPFIVLLMAMSFSARSQELDAAAAGSPRKVPAGKHCTARLEKLEPGASESRISSFDCYQSFSEAIYAVTEGAVFLPPDESLKNQLKALRQELKSIENASTVGGGSVILAIDYQHSNYGGVTLTYYGYTGCTSTTSYIVPSLSTVGWDNVVSSTQAFNGCIRNILYEHPNYGGASLTCTPNCSSVGVMNDATSSRRFEGPCGEWSCVNPDGNYISHFTGAYCDGLEYYYLAYDGFAYQCRPNSTFGAAACGTTQNNVTAYSYRYQGQCYPNAWPSGNPLDNMVRVYR